MSKELFDPTPEEFAVRLTKGYTLAKMAEVALIKACRRRAEVNENGDVSIPKHTCIEDIWDDDNFIKAFEDLAEKLWEDVSDQVRYEKRREWSDERELERTLKQIDASMRREEIQ